MSRSDSDNEKLSDFEEEENVINFDNEIAKNESKIRIKENKEGNNKLHFLPFKIFHTGPCKVSTYFDPLIETTGANVDSKIIQENKPLDCKTSFRGRILKGKHVKINDQFSLRRVTLQRKGIKTQKVIVKSVKDLNDYYIWKFDEEVPYNNTLLNLNTIVSNMDVLK